MNRVLDPFAGPPPKEVHLPKAPLVRVIVQLRFPAIASLARLEYIGAFQEAIRERFPVLRPGQNMALRVEGGELSIQSGAETIWRFRDKSDTWRVSLAPSFVALETTRYSSRDDFFACFQSILEALHELTKIEVYDRLGVRYVN